MTRRPDEPVRLTRIYTRGGDRGETSLGDGTRVSKLDPRIRAYGGVDELNSQLGVVVAAGGAGEAITAPLERIQNELFDLGADISVPLAADGGGTPAAAHLHVARTICRRAEIATLAIPDGVNPLALVYLNRLSDLLFILARAANAGRPEPLWRPGSSHS